jgi:serine/threonine-protein phosphatase PP1 catalytic subunit
MDTESTLSLNSYDMSNISRQQSYENIYNIKYQHPDCYIYEHHDDVIEKNYFDSLFEKINMANDDQKNILNFIKKIFENKNLLLDDIININIFIDKYKNIIDQPSQLNIDLDSQITIIGDIHGDLDAMFFQLFMAGGFEDNHKFLFLGDYLDRGANGIECLYLLFLLRYLFPSQIYFLRGNHEDLQVCLVGGTMKEISKKIIEERNIKEKHDSIFYLKQIENLFVLLPFAANIGNIIFACHGCPNEHTPYDLISKINKDSVRDIPYKINHIVSNLIWSDPTDQNSNDSSSNLRGEGYYVPQNITEKFLKTNNFSLIIRAHQCVNDGYYFQHNNTVLTLFGQPDYCGMLNNSAAYMNINPDGTTQIIQFANSDIKKLNNVICNLKKNHTNIKLEPKKDEDFILHNYFKD